MAYSEKQKTEIIDSICLDLMEGKKVREAIQNVSIPKKTLFQWLQQDKVKSDQYARAMEVRADLMAEEILEICDATENDVITDKDGNQITNHSVINRDRLRVDTRKWLMSKLIPKKYSDRHMVDHTTKGESINKIERVIIDNETSNKDA